MSGVNASSLVSDVLACAARKLRLEADNLGARAQRGLLDGLHVGDRVGRPERVHCNDRQPSGAPEHPVECGLGVGHITRVADQIVLRGGEAHLRVDHIEARHRAGVEPRLRALEEIRGELAGLGEIAAVQPRDEDGIVGAARLRGELLLQQAELRLRCVDVLHADRGSGGGTCRGRAP